MEQLVAQVLPLAIGAAISPFLLVVQLKVLSGKHKPVARAAGVTLGAGAALIVLSLAFTTVLRGFGAATPGTNPSLGLQIVRGIALVLLFALGAHNLRNRNAAPNTAREKKMATARWRSFVAIGFVIMVSNVTTLVLFAPALHMIVNSDFSNADKITVYLVLWFITLMPLTVPLLLTVSMGSRSDAMLARLNTFVTKHNAVINAVVCFGFAIYIGYLMVQTYL